MKRCFDFMVSAVGLVFLLPVLGIVAVLIKLDSKGPVFFRQERMGRGFRPFWIYKFRTMVVNAPSLGALLTSGEDPRITRVGRLLRKTKVDELPQLFNVMMGDMSLVGPRPEVRRYAEMFRQDYEEVLTVRPGITDPASLKYCDESELLGSAADPEQEYVMHVLPDKIRLAKEYIHHGSFLSDLSLILKTIFKMFVFDRISGSNQSVVMARSDLPGGLLP
jgi:lipopolysaccharide/colanic/teichoic acid biosynthesis glycosyltransferase